jgi:hypothetical protein
MGEPLVEVLGQLRNLLGMIDEAAAQALHAQADAQEAHASYHEAAIGSRHPQLARAVVDSRTAGEKAGKTARLLAEAANAFADYIEMIAPGTVPSRRAEPGAMPGGEALLDQAEDRARRADAFWSKQVKKADDGQDSLENAEKGARAFFTHQKKMPDAPGATGTSTGTPVVAQQNDGTQVDNPIAAVAMAVAAAAVAVKAFSNHKKKRRADQRAERQ